MQEQVKNFLNSNLTETEYYSLPKENLITLKEYLLQLKEKDNEFDKAIEKHAKSIKQKCTWVNKISFGGLVSSKGIYETTAIYLYSNDGIDLIITHNISNNEYEDLTKYVPKIYLLSRKVRKHLKRQNDINLIQKELEEIENIGREIYIDVLKYISSVSENFEIYYTPHLGLSVYNDFDLIASYSNCTKRQKEYIKDEDSKQKLLKRIMIKTKQDN